MVENKFWVLLLGVKKRKAWNKSREKYIPVKRRQNLAEKDKGSYYKEEWLEEFLDSKGAFYSGNESDNNDESCNKNNEQQLGLANICYKIVSPILLQKIINDFAVCKHYSGTLLLVEDVNHGFGS